MEDDRTGYAGALEELQAILAELEGEAVDVDVLATAWHEPTSCSPSAGSGWRPPGSRSKGRGGRRGRLIRPVASPNVRLHQCGSAS